MNRPNNFQHLGQNRTHKYFQWFVLVCAGARGTEFNAECTGKCFKAPENRFKSPDFSITLNIHELNE